MKSSTRIELFGRQSVVSVPFRMHPAYIPHAVLIAVIVLACVVDAAMQTVSWITGA